MLHEETVEKRTLDLIKKFSNDTYLKDFVLVGGTALALQIGHRTSVDIDLFNAVGFDTDDISAHLEKNYDADDLVSRKHGVFCRIEGIKIDLIPHPIPGSIRSSNLRKSGWPLWKI